MSSLYVTGPVYVYAGLASGSSPAFVGVGDRAPRIQIKPYYEKVLTDLGGSAAASDVIYNGVEASVSVDLTRYNEALLRTMQDYANTTATAIRGFDDPGNIGSLMGLEGWSYQLWLRFPLAAKTVFQGGGNAANAMPSGYRFVQAYLDGEDLESGSSTARKIRVTWRCLRQLDITVNNGLGQGRWLLYDHSMIGLPPID